MTYSRKVALGFSVVFVCLALANVGGYAVRLVLAHSLSPEEFGLVYAVFGLFGFIAMLQTMGLSDALLQRFQTLNARRRKTAFLTVIHVQLLATGIILLIAFLLAPWLAVHYFKTQIAIPLLLVYGLSIFLSPIPATITAVFQGSGKLQWYGYATLVQAMSLFLFTLAFITAGLGVLAAVLAYALTFSLMIIIYYPLLRKLLPGKFSFTYDFALLKSFFRYSIPLMLSSVAGVFMATIDTFFLTIFRSLKEVGLYNAALPTAGILWFLHGVINNVFFPIVSEMNAKKNLHLLVEGIGSMYSYLTIIVVPFAVILLIFADVVLNTLFGGAYVGATLALQLLVVGGIFYLYHAINTSALNGIGNTKANLHAFVIAGSINVIVDLLLIPKFGIDGCAVATMIALFVLFLVTLLELRKKVPFTLEYGRISKVILVGVVFAVITVLLRSLLQIPLWPKIAITLLVSGACYVALIFLLRILGRDELMVLKARVLRR